MKKLRRRRALVLVLLFAGMVLPRAAGAQEGSGTLALVGGMLLDGYETPPIHHAAVVIEGNRIVAVGPASEVDIPAGAEIVDTEGMTMLPGLIDRPILDEAREEMMAISAKQLLMAGVTTAVDLGGPLEILNVRDAINEGRLPGPRMLVSGPWIARAGGRFPLWIQRLVASPDEAAEQADDLIDAGVDVIKTWVGMTEEDIRAVVNTAHGRGVEVHSHLYAPGDMWAAIRGGTDVIQHAGSGGNPPYTDDLIAEIAHRGIPVVQTIAHRIRVYPATLEFPERLQDARLREDLPADLYQVIGRGRDLGTIEPGKLADIIVVEGNPLFDINALGYVRMVVKDGNGYK